MDKYQGLEHWHPAEKSPDLLVHDLIFRDEQGEPIAGVRFKYMNHPFPFYYLKLLWVIPEQQGKHIGSELLGKFNDFMKEKGKAGILWNSISKDLATNNIYETHGWRPAPENEWFTYNLPEGVTPEQVQAAIDWTYTSAVREDERKERLKEEKGLSAVA